MAQAGLLAVQTLALLVVASRVAGGAVALQIALNFYFLPIAAHRDADRRWRSCPAVALHQSG